MDDSVTRIANLEAALRQFTGLVWRFYDEERKWVQLDGLVRADVLEAARKLTEEVK